MLLKYFYDKRLAQASYLVGCAATGEALVVDPMRDIQPYLQSAAEEGLRVTHITETHIHADFVSGARELAQATGAQLYLSDMGDADWKYGYTAPNITLLQDGDSFMVGNIRVTAKHTPGHTPEHLAFFITDTAAADQPIGIFTGDFLFAGDVGRPDLLEAAAGFVGTKEIGARHQFASVQAAKAEPDYLQIWPGHGAGSACGKALGAIPSTTLGYEKLFSPAFQFEDEESFGEWLLSGQPDAPFYFAQMKKVNKEGPALLAALPAPQPVDRATLAQALAEGALVIDLRNREDFAKAHLPGTVNIAASNTGFINYVGWMADYTKPTYFISPDAESITPILTALRSIGVDDVPGYALPDVITGDTATQEQISAAELAAIYPSDDVFVLDVRSHADYEAGHIQGAHNIALGYLEQRLTEVPRDRRVVVHCASGYRSQIGVSLLQKHGYTNVANLNDSQVKWSNQLPLERAAE